ncbi:MAG TPA: pilus assembly protein N-terminal domain-containing protein [Acidobacteriaceae bacterium]
MAQTPNTLATEQPAIRSGTAADVIHITVDHSVVLTSAAPLRRVYVGNPTVLQTFTSGTNQVVLTAKAPGVSSMVLWEELGGNRLYTVSADVDPEALQASLTQAFPGLSLYAEAGGGGKIVLTGSVQTEALSEAAFKMASQYTKDVVNSVHVVPVHGKQVQLKLRIVEVDRTRLDQLGVNIFAGGRTSIGTTTEQFNSAVTDTASSIQVSNPLNLFLFNSKLDVGMTVRDLEQKQILQVLASPRLRP